MKIIEELKAKLENASAEEIKALQQNENPIYWFLLLTEYPEFAPDAIREMARQTGAPVFDETGLLKRGTVIRHLILPGRLEESKRVMDWVAANFAPGEVLFSLMSQ